MREVVVKIGRINDNGTKECILANGSDVEDLLEQSIYDIDEDKEVIIARSTGRTVELEDKLVDGEVYIISPNIKSA